LRQNEKFERLTDKLTHLSLGFVRQGGEKLDGYEERISRSTRTLLYRENERLSHIEKKTELVNPLNVLKRGYSMTLHDGKLISGIEDLGAGDKLETRLYNGSLISKVEKIIKSHDKREN